MCQKPSSPVSVRPASPGSGVQKHRGCGAGVRLLPSNQRRRTKKKKAILKSQSLKRKNVTSSLQEGEKGKTSETLPTVDFPTTSLRSSRREVRSEQKVGGVGAGRWVGGERAPATGPRKGVFVHQNKRNQRRPVQTSVSEAGRRGPPPSVVMPGTAASPSSP